MMKMRLMFFNYFSKNGFYKNTTAPLRLQPPFFTMNQPTNWAGTSVVFGALVIFTITIIITNTWRQNLNAVKV